MRGETPQENEGTLDPEVKTTLERLSHIESMISTEKKSGSFHLVPFFVKIEIS